MSKCARLPQFALGSGAPAAKEDPAEELRWRAVTGTLCLIVVRWAALRTSSRIFFDRNLRDTFGVAVELRRDQMARCDGRDAQHDRRDDVDRSPHAGSAS